MGLGFRDDVVGRYFRLTAQGDYRREPDGRFFYRLGVDGKQSSRLTNDASMDFDPDWRPIGVP